MPKIEIEATTEEYELWTIGSRIEGLKKEMKTLNDQRTQLIKQLYEDGYPQNHIAKLAGVTSARVSQIVTGYYEKK
jgi:DNA-directed RNA polymerase specialized sigma subunit